ncbi:MAG: hypothetical protein ACLFPI_07795 [Desulfobacterales bacterium]
MINKSPVTSFARAVAREVYLDGNQAMPTMETQHLIDGMMVFLLSRNNAGLLDAQTEPVRDVALWLCGIGLDGTLDGQALEKYLERLALSFADVRDLGLLKARLAMGFEGFYVEVMSGTRV